MRLLATALSMMIMAAALLAVIPPAHAQSCQQLWVERNSYYKARGYCFKTPRAIAYFGNAGCYIHDESRVPFTQWERNRIDQIVRLERRFGC
jgi:YARHG domain-containing protein